MADFQAELAFAKTYLNTLGRQPVAYADDYHQAPENSLKKVPVLPLPVPPVPERKSIESGVASDSALISITFKSLKPPLIYSQSVSLTDTVLSIKELLQASHPDDLPAAEFQRLLLKGKALADQKLLKEYSIKDGDTINLMFKAPPPKSNFPLATPQPIRPEMSNSSPNPFASAAGSLNPDVKTTSSGGRRHQRIPSVVLSPSPSNDTQATGERLKEIVLDLDLDTSVPLSPVLRDEMTMSSTYHDTISKPEFWQQLLVFLKSHFHTEADVLVAFEDFLRTSKMSLTASDIARIRDQTGIVGMAGT